MAEKDDEDKRYSLDDMRTDTGDAFMKASPYHTELRDIYKYFMPWRLPTTERSGVGGARSEGTNLGNANIYDSTGVGAAASFAANMQADWMPHFEPIFKLEPGPIYNGPDKEQYAKLLEAISTVIHSALGPVRLNAQPVLQDLFAGTGAMFMEQGELNNKPMRGVAVPVLETAMEVGPWDDIERVWWRRNYKARHLQQRWPDAKIEDDLAGMIRDNKNVDVEVTQYTYWDAAEKAWRLVVWTNKGKSILARHRYKQSPWITPRLMVSPGESFGRGFAHLALPTAKTLNKSQELALRAAAFALLGMWMRRNDGVFNPETAVMKPGGFLKVAHTSGPFKSIERLPVPQNFDVSSFVAKELRENLRRVTLDDDLPELADRVRSPTEIAARLRRYDRNRGGNTVRLASELIVPIALRAIEVCQNVGLLKDLNLNIDQVTTQITVLSPAAVAARSAKTERLVSAIQIITGLFGAKAAALIVEIEKAIPDMARWMGVDEAHLRTSADVEQLKAMVAQYIAELQASEQAKAVQAKAQVMPEKASEAMYTNGMM